MRYPIFVVPMFFFMAALGCDRGESGNDSAASSNTQTGREIVEAAIKAHGLVAYRELQAGEMKVFTRGYVSAEIEDEITTISAFQLPDRLQELVTHGVRGDDKRSRSIYVRFGSEAWSQDEGKEFQSDEPMPISMLYPLQLLHQMLEFRKEALLARLEDKPAQGRPAQWVQVTLGDATGQFAFDPSTHLLIGSTMPAQNPKTGKMGVSETWYSDYRQFGGMTLPAACIGYLDGEKFVERTVHDFNVLKKIEDATMLSVLSRDAVKPGAGPGAAEQKAAPAAPADGGAGKP